MTDPAPPAAPPGWQRRPERDTARALAWKAPAGWLVLVPRGTAPRVARLPGWTVVEGAEARHG